MSLHAMDIAGTNVGKWPDLYFTAVPGLVLVFLRAAHRCPLPPLPLPPFRPGLVTLELVAIHASPKTTGLPIGSSKAHHETRNLRPPDVIEHH